MNKMTRRISRFFSLHVVAGAAALIVGVASAAAGANQFAQRYLSDAAEDAMFSKPVAATRPSIASTSGRAQVIVRLNEPPVALSELEAAEALEAIEAEQQGFLDRCLKLGDIKVLSKTRVALNAIFLELDATLMDPVSGDPAVQRIAPVSHYTLDLSETVPYIGADSVQKRGIDGSGISVAVLDSGVDYTHADLGGSGDPADYANNDGTVIEPGTFPTEKVVGGFDFLGNVWPTGPGGFTDAPLPDPDPIDDLALVPGAFAGHGTHVADIIGGNEGVAPGVDIYGLKVCASLTPSCNGIALINGVEFVVDPNGDGNPEDHLDIMNLSLGSDYGRPFDDELSAAIDNATAIGVLTVASAGNCGDNPYCTGTPAAAPTALSVAQTNVPSAVQRFMNVVEPAALAGLYSAVQYPWTPQTGPVEGPVQYGDFDGTNLLGCDPFVGDLTGFIVAVDRGVCPFAEKIRNIQNAGGTAGIVMLVADGAPFAGTFDGGDPITIPGFNISLADGNILRGGGAVVGFSPESNQSLEGVTVGTTARGPDLSFNALKPEIGAPGASVSAEVGTGVERSPFGGTSGASPMVAGSAALLLENCRASSSRFGRGYDVEAVDSGSGKFRYYKRSRLFRKLIRKYRRIRDRECSPLEIKASLMNNAFRDIVSDTTGGLAEVSRIGAGEVRVDDSLRSKVIAWSPDDGQPSLSLAFRDMASATKLVRKVSITNRSWFWQRLEVNPVFRFADDEATGALQIRTPRRIWVGPGRTKTFKVKFAFDPSKLSGNSMNSGSNGSDASTLTALEYDGYIVMNDWRGDEVALPWHVMPRQAAEVVPSTTEVGPTGGTIPLSNNGAGIAAVDGYTLVGVSDEKPDALRGAENPQPDLKAVGVRTFFSAACASQFGWAFAINTWDRQSHLLPTSFIVNIDTDRDGVFDFFVQNGPLSLFTVGDLSDARVVTAAFDANTGAGNFFFFAEHATNTANTVLRICGDQVGLTAADIQTTPVDIQVVAQSLFGSDPDVIDGITITPLGEGLFPIPAGDIPAGEVGSVDVLAFPPPLDNSPELGVMLFTNGDRGPGAHGGATAATESVLLFAPGTVPPAPLF